MVVTKEGKYRAKNGNVFDVVNVSPKGCEPYFRAYWNGGYYNVNKMPGNYPFDEVEMEMVEYIGPLDINEFQFVDGIPEKARLGVAIIVLRPFKGIYLAQRFKDDEFGCPGGKADDTDFSLEDAARRELREETGLEIEEERLDWVGYQKVTTESTDYTSWYMLVLRDGEELVNKEPHKHGNWRPYMLSEALKLPLFHGTRPTLELLDSKLNKQMEICRDQTVVERIKSILPLTYYF